jgi:glycosyltransferase involved in cell wall biosynthesis
LTASDKTAVAGSPPATVCPPIFWSAYGITNPYSGIGNVAQALNLSLKKQGCIPTIAGEAPQPQFAHNPILRTSNSLLHYLQRTRICAADLHFFSIRKRSDHGIFHGFSNFNVPLFAPSDGKFRFVLTVHDLIPLIAPQMVSRTSAIQFEIMIRPALRRATTVVAVSRSTANAIAAKFPEVASRIRVVRNGTNSLPTPPEPMGHRWIDGLFVGRFEAYKRFDFLSCVIKANPSCKFLVVTDQRGQRFLQKTCIKAIENNHLRVVSGVQPMELLHYYRQAKILLLTSSHEGFCLPFVEAASQGCAAIWTRLPALLELATESNGPGLEASLGPDNWAMAFEQTLANWEPTTPLRVLEATKGWPTWDAAAQSLISLYNS